MTAVWVSANAENEIGLTRHDSSCLSGSSEDLRKKPVHILFPLVVHIFTSPAGRHAVNYNVEDALHHTYVNPIRPVCYYIMPVDSLQEMLLAETLMNKVCGLLVQLNKDPNLNIFGQSKMVQVGSSFELLI